MDFSEKLFNDFSGWAERKARRYCRAVSIQAADVPWYENAALMGLWTAAKTFKESRGLKFLTFAAHHVAGAIRDEARRIDDLARSERRLLQQGFAVPRVVRRLADGDDQRPGQNAHAINAMIHSEAVNRALRFVRPRERYVLTRYYGDGWSQAQIGRELQLSEKRIGELRVRAMTAAKKFNFVSE